MSSSKNKISRKILESTEIQKAAIIMSSKSLVDDVQDMIEDVSNMRVKSLVSITEQVKNIYGAEFGDEFQTTMDSEIAKILEVLEKAKMVMEDEVTKLSGDTPPPRDINVYGDSDVDINIGSEEDDDSDENIEIKKPDGDTGRRRKVTVESLLPKSLLRKKKVKEERKAEWKGKKFNVAEIQTESVLLKDRNGNIKSVPLNEIKFF